MRSVPLAHVKHKQDVKDGSPEGNELQSRKNIQKALALIELDAHSALSTTARVGRPDIGPQPLVKILIVEKSVHWGLSSAVDLIHLLLHRGHVSPLSFISHPVLSR